MWFCHQETRQGLPIGRSRREAPGPVGREETCPEARPRDSPPETRGVCLSSLKQEPAGGSSAHGGSGAPCPAGAQPWGATLQGYRLLSALSPHLSVSAGRGGVFIPVPPPPSSAPLWLEERRRGAGAGAGGVSALRSERCHCWARRRHGAVQGTRGPVCVRIVRAAAVCGVSFLFFYFSTDGHETSVLACIFNKHVPGPVSSVCCRGGPPRDPLSTQGSRSVSPTDTRPGGWPHRAPGWAGSVVPLRLASLFDRF